MQYATKEACSNTKFEMKSDQMFALNRRRESSGTQRVVPAKFRVCDYQSKLNWRATGKRGYIKFDYEADLNLNDKADSKNSLRFKAKLRLLQNY